MSVPGRPPGPDRTLPLLVLLAVAVRVLRSSTTLLLNADGSTYISAAQGMQEGDCAQAFETDLHPLYPLLVAGLDLVLGQVRVAGVLVSLAGAAAATVALHRLARLGWGESAARFTAFLYAIHPVFADQEGKVLTEGLYRGFGLWALYLSWSAWRSGSWKQGLAAGACLGAAWLTRVEGVLLAGMVTAGLWLRLAWPGRTRQWGPTLAAAAALLVVVAPYLGWLKWDTGRWRLSPRGSMERAVAAGGLKTYDDSPKEAALRERYGLAGAAVLNQAYLCYRVYYPVPLALAIAGIAFFRRGSLGGDLGRALLAFWAVYVAAIGYVYYVSVTHISMRYVGFPCLVLLPWAGYGLERLVDAAGRRSASTARAVAMAVAVILLARALFRTSDPHEQPTLDACAWVRARSAAPSRIIFSRDPAPYHAGGRHVHAYTAASMRTAIDREGVDFMIFEEPHLAGLPKAERDLILKAPGVTFRARFGPEGAGVAVYEVVASR